MSDSGGAEIAGRMVIIGSANAMVGLDAGWDVLAGGGSVIDAVEVATRLVEDNKEDHSVGLGGYPNLLGEVELDASIMEGTDRRAGAVGALRGHRAAISLARRVMEELPHVLLVGEGAARFARECRMEEEDLLTAETRARWEEVIDRQLHGAPMPDALAELARLATDPERAAGTVNIMARDAAGHIASAVSTSGWAWKYPGRLGDSPVIGAGNYADNRYGAAACTGFGELALRASTARTVVADMQQGASVEEACVAAIRDLGGLGSIGHSSVIMNIVALDSHGHHAAASTNPEAKYAVRTEWMTAAELAPRLHVAL